MKNIDSLNYVLQIANNQQLRELTEKVEKLTPPDWQKFVIPVVSLFTAIIGAISAYLVAMALFKRNRLLELEKIRLTTEKEEKLKNETKLKEKNDLIRKLYSDGSTTMILFTNTILNLNHHDLLRYYYLMQAQNEENQFKQQSIELYNKEHEHYLSTDIKVRELIGKLSGIITEYSYIRKENNVINSLQAFMTKDLIRVKKEKLNIKKNRSEIEKDLNDLVLEAKNELEFDIDKHLKPILLEMNNQSI